MVVQRGSCTIDRAMIGTDPGTMGTSQSEPDMFAAAFHANHASSDNLGFDTDEDFGWANQQFTNSISSNPNGPSNLNQHMARFKKIKPKVEKIDNDDETWFSEASDVEGPCKEKRTLKKKRRNRPRQQASGLEKPTTSAVQRGADDNLLVQQSVKGGDATDDESSQRENFFDFPSNFDNAFGNSSTGFMNGSAKNSSNHLGLSETKSSEHSFTSAGLPTVLNSSVSTGSLSSPLTEKKSSISSAPVSPANEKVYAGGASNSLNSKTQNAWLGEIKRIQKISLQPDSDEQETLTTLDQVGQGSKKVSSNSPKTSPTTKDRKAISSLAAAAALMNRSKFGEIDDTVSNHSAKSDLVSSVTKMYMQPSKRTEPLPASEHAPRKQATVGKKRPVVQRQRSVTSTKMGDSNNSLHG